MLRSSAFTVTCRHWGLFGMLGRDSNRTVELSDRTTARALIRPGLVFLPFPRTCCVASLFNEPVHVLKSWCLVANFIAKAIEPFRSGTFHLAANNRYETRYDIRPQNIDSLVRRVLGTG